MLVLNFCEAISLLVQLWRVHACLPSSPLSDSSVGIVIIISYVSAIGPADRLCGAIGAIGDSCICNGCCHGCLAASASCQSRAALCQQPARCVMERPQQHQQYTRHCRVRGGQHKNTHTTTSTVSNQRRRGHTAPASQPKTSPASRITQRATAVTLSGPSNRQGPK